MAGLLIPYRLNVRAARLCAGVWVALLVCASTVFADEPTRDLGELLDHALDAAVLAMEETAAIRALEGAEIVEVRLACERGLCRRPSVREALLRIAGLVPGMQAEAQVLAVARANLEATGSFSRVRTLVLPREGGAEVVLELEPGRVIRKIYVCPGASLEEEIRRRLFVRSGQVLEEPHAPLLQRQAEVLDDYLQRQGFFGNTVRIMTLDEAAAWSETDEGHSLCAAGRYGYRASSRSRQLDRRERTATVDLVVHVRRGERQRLAGIYVRGHEALTYEEIRDILLGRFTLLLGVTSERLRDAADAVIERYRALGYLQARYARLDFHVVDGAVSLYLDIREGPRWEVNFEGNELLTDRELLRALPFYETGFIDTEEIRLAERNLRLRYETQGYPAVRITHQRFTTAEGVEVLSFFIDEQGWAAVRSIQFEGLPVDVDPASLRSVMGTREYSALSTAGVLQRSVLDRDIRSLESAMEGLGYAMARVTHLEIERSADGRDLNLVFHLLPGPRFRVESVAVEGWPESGSVAWEREPLQLRDGGIFNARWLAEDRDRLRGALEGDGYIEVRVDASCVDEHQQESPCLPALLPAECRVGLSDLLLPTRARTRSAQQSGSPTEVTYALLADVDACRPDLELEDLQVRVRHVVEIGPRYRFGDVIWRGNHRTRQRIVRRELAFERDDLYDAGVLLETQRRLRYLGLFSSVRVQPVARLEPEGDAEVSVAPVILQVEETGFRTLEHRVGLETRLTTLVDPLVIFGNETVFRERNIGGSGSELRLVGELDLDILNVERVGEGELDSALRAIYFMPRLWLLGVRRAPWEGRFTLYFERELLSLPPLPLRREVGLDVRVRQELRRIRGLFLELGSQVRYVEALDQGETQVDARFEPSFIISVIPRLSLERRDNPLHPSRGYYLDTSVELASGILAVVESEQYLKTTTRGSVYLPLSEVFTLALGARVGAATGLGAAGARPPGGYVLPLSERFSLGGISSLRGFREGEIRVLGRDDFGGDYLLQGSVELRYPFLAEQSLFGALFVDHGALGRVPSDLRPEAFRTSVGFGLRWLVADLIPLVLDYGVVVDRRPGESVSLLQFNVGYTF